MKFSAIILAGGESERFGQNKLLLPLNGKTVLENTIERFANPDIQEILVVVGKFGGAYQKAVECENVKWISNPDYAQGMSSSIKAGIKHLASDGDAVFITPADIPSFKKDTVAAMMKQFRSNKIIIPVYRGRKGHPVLLDKAIAQECLSAQSEKVLYDVIRNYQNSVEYLAVEDEGIVVDIDTMEDYEKMKSAANGRN